MESDQLDKADLALHNILASDPNSAEALTLGGILLTKQGRTPEGLECLKRANELRADDAETLTWLGLASRILGDLDAAIEFSLQAAVIQPNNFEAFNVLGICLLARGKAKDANKALLRAFSLKPADVATRANLAMSYRLLNEGQMALELFQSAMKAEPDRAQHHVQVGRQLLLLSRLSEAAVQLESSLESHPNSLALADMLALTYGRLNRHAAAERVFQRIYRLAPASANNYATYLQESGRFSDSINALAESVRMLPDQGEAYRLLVEAGITEWDGAPLAQKLERLFESENLDDKSRMHLAYALGKLADKDGRTSEAMAWFDQANERAFHIYPGCQGFDPSSCAHEAQAIASVYSSAFFSKNGAVSQQKEQPIFIVGMIRSGTTLLDQIISAHSQLSSVGEGGFWGAEADKFHIKLKKAELTTEDIATLAAGYLGSVSWTYHSERFTDKMPLNYRHIGLIRSVFPEAKFIHIRRDAFDTCLSIYTTFFAGGPSFAYKPEHICAFYRCYLDTMSHWRAVLPSSAFLEVDYETMVVNPEPSIRQILEFLNLPWDERCLHHEDNQASITTPSRWQARQPLYRTSIGKRAKYGKYAPTLASLPQLSASE